MAGTDCQMAMPHASGAEHAERQQADMLGAMPAGWTQSGAAVVSPRGGAGGRETVTVLHRFHFSSALKRMAALVRVRRAPQPGFRV